MESAPWENSDGEGCRFYWRPHGQEGINTVGMQNSTLFSGQMLMKIPGLDPLVPVLTHPHGSGWNLDSTSPQVLPSGPPFPGPTQHSFDITTV